MVYFAMLHTGAIKIGTTWNLDQRLPNLASHYGGKLTVLHVMEGDIQVEREIQARFSHLRFKGTEQFKPASDLMEFIGRPPMVEQDPDTVEPAKVNTGGRIKTAARLSPDTLAWLDNLRIKRQLSSISDAIEWLVQELAHREARRIERLRARKGARP